MDAAAITLKYSVTPQPGLAQMLGSDFQNTQPQYLQDITKELFEHMATVTNDSQYNRLGTKIQNIDKDDVDIVKTKIITAQEKQKQEAKQRVSGQTQDSTQ